MSLVKLLLILAEPSLLRAYLKVWAPEAAPGNLELIGLILAVGPFSAALDRLFAS